MKIKQDKTSPTDVGVILVDSNDQFLGVAEKIHAHKHGLLHRAFSIFIYNEKGEVLLQQRSPEKYHCGNMWTNTCCSHSVLNEDIYVSANKRLEFEMNIASNLTFVDKFLYKADLGSGMIEHEIDYVFVGLYQGENICPNPNEAINFRWVDIKSLREEILSTPNIFTPWLCKALEVATRHQHFQQI